jgi:hypothetical protein
MNDMMIYDFTGSRWLGLLTTPDGHHYDVVGFYLYESGRYDYITHEGERIRATKGTEFHEVIHDALASNHFEACQRLIKYWYSRKCDFELWTLCYKLRGPDYFLKAVFRNDTDEMRLQANDHPSNRYRIGN